MTAAPLDRVARPGTVPLPGDVLAVFAPLFLAFGLVLVTAPTSAFAGSACTLVLSARCSRAPPLRPWRPPSNSST